MSEQPTRLTGTLRQCLDAIPTEHTGEHPITVFLKHLSDVELLEPLGFLIGLKNFSAMIEWNGHDDWNITLHGRGPTDESQPVS